MLKYGVPTYYWSTLSIIRQSMALYFVKYTYICTRICVVFVFQKYTYYVLQYAVVRLIRLLDRYFSIFWICTSYASVLEDVLTITFIF